MINFFDCLTVRFTSVPNTFGLQEPDLHLHVSFRGRNIPKRCLMGCCKENCFLGCALLSVKGLPCARSGRSRECVLFEVLRGRQAFA